ncbi:MAG: hypothetical protein DYH07_12085 [Armatimonadetes bacterium ATM1]|nr:MAG: hypothetical protein EDM73_11385 [Armatimonadota bacterium]MBC6970502.1 hypothetical protein [Armatimonadota bacterium]MCE7900813.1 hypothetical protein [Armatimonadetes bacterium ATM1]RIJ95549.1 MAG: hypothetical protein DCC45_10095 [Armatimonadota bacterium]
MRTRNGEPIPVMSVSLLAALFSANGPLEYAGKGVFVHGDDNKLTFYEANSGKRIRRYHAESGISGWSTDGEGGVFVETGGVLYFMGPSGGMQKVREVVYPRLAIPAGCLISSEGDVVSDFEWADGRTPSALVWQKGKSVHTFSGRTSGALTGRHDFELLSFGSLRDTIWVSFPVTPTEYEEEEIVLLRLTENGQLVQQKYLGRVSAAFWVGMAFPWEDGIVLVDSGFGRIWILGSGSPRMVQLGNRRIRAATLARSAHVLLVVTDDERRALELRALDLKRRTWRVLRRLGTEGETVSLENIGLAVFESGRTAAIFRKDRLSVVKVESLWSTK